MCSSEIKISIYIFPRWALLFQTSNPLQFLSQQVLVIPPTPTLWNFRDFPTWLGTPWKNISVQYFQYFQYLLVFWLFDNCCDRLVLNVWQSLQSHLTIDYAQTLFFSWSVDQNARDTNYHERDWRRETWARKESFLLGLPSSFLASRFRARALPSLNLKKKRDR